MTFKVGIEGSATLQWQSFSNGVWADIAGANGTEYTIARTSGSDDGRQFRVLVSSTGKATSSLASSVATLKVVQGVAWSFSSPSFVGASLNAVRWIDSNTAVAVGSGGAIIRTKDAGLNWSIIRGHVAGTEDLTQLSVLDSKTLLASGKKLLLRSTDAGLSWTTLAAPSSSKLAMAFRTSLAGVAAEYGGKLYRTMDGGQSWTAGQVPASAVIETLECRQQLCIASGVDSSQMSRKNAWKSTDDGLSWTPIDFKTPLTTLDLRAITFAGDGILYAEGRYTAGRSRDGGSSWEWWSLPGAHMPSSSGVLFADGAHGISRSGAYRTQDGGSTWTKVESVPFRSEDAADLALSSSGLGLAIDGGGRIKRSTDFGNTWTSVFQGPDHDLEGYDFTGVAFSSRETGLAVCSQGIVATNDGGKSWKLAPLPSMAQPDMKAVAFADAQTAVIANYMPLRSTDGGKSWQVVNGLVVGTNPVVGFSSAGWGLVGGSAGVYRSTDGGATWSMVSTQGGPWGFGALAIRDSVALLSGSAGGMMRSTDSGKTWSLVPGFTDWIKSLAWVDARTVYALNTQGQVLRSSDAGLSWSPLNGVVSGRFATISFTKGGQLGLIAGAGILLHSVDGGQTWIKDLEGPSFFWQAVGFADEHSPVMVGMDGVIATGSGY
ncbi:hypothetical protein H5407_20300 [Mitsuaria sp. WAJ17]|uniref:WD40/YVTN/BNR-like repeat-containing protein n=1 Tax=Mitsuaria sp. WAJ17 TaxID=2761452 RepID=UPI001602331E|nr:YCF48-related protein [Mitsuaria sp. WAJ17]MBB2487583.1 hypothetical protein [Mitsuaria sp. WAJ17]